MDVKYGLAIFDLDGTLIDSSPGITDCVRRTVEHYGLPALTDDALRSFIGPPVEYSFGRHFGLDGERLAEVCAHFRALYSTEGIYGAALYPGIADVLDTLRAHGIKTAIATNKRHRYTVPLLEHLGVMDKLDSVHGTDDNGVLTKDVLIQRCMADCGIADKQQALMIGDTCHDLNAAKTAGVDFAPVAYGFGFGTDDDFEHIAQTTTDILTFFNIEAQ